MGTRDNLKAVIEALRDRHGLLAAYLEAAGNIDWQALHQPVSIDKLVPISTRKGVRHQPDRVFGGLFFLAFYGLRIR